MTMIDWSDPEEMFGLLCEYVADERNSAGDPVRHRFLRRLEANLQSVADEIDHLPPSRLISRLRILHRSQPTDFTNDPVLAHLEDCIAELERIQQDRPE